MSIKNIAHKHSKKYQTGVGAELNETLNYKTLAEARPKRAAIIEEYRDLAEVALVCLVESFENIITAIILLIGLRCNAVKQRLASRLRFP